MINVIMLVLVASTAYQGPAITPGPNPWLPAIKAQEPSVPEITTYSIPYISSVRHSTFVPEKYGDMSRIEFSNGITFDTKYLGKNGEPSLPPDLMYDQRSDAKYYIVQFTGPIYRTQRDWLKSQNITIHYYIPNYGFVCRIDDPAAVSEVAANPAVLWTGIYHPAYKISHLLNDLRGEFRVLIRLFNDADYGSALAEVKALTGRSDFETVDNGINKLIIGTIDLAAIPAIARLKSVYWVEPSFPLHTMNATCQYIVQSGTTNVRNIWAKGITGEGEITNSFDSGIHCPHYAKRAGSAAITTWGVYPAHYKIVAYDSGASASIVFGDGAGASYHGSHTAGTICGNDTTLGTNANDGMAKNARHYFNDCGDNASSSIYTFGDLNDGFIRPYNKYYASHGIRAYLSSNSWGQSVTQVYNDQSLQADQFMWGHKDFCIFFSNGNSGSGAGTVNPPATAKNVVSVGATSNSLPPSIASFSSRGPTADGRYKPTICAPGQSLTSSTSGTNTYGSMQGTSMSCPAACGSGALVRQYLREGWYPYGKKVAGDAWTYISAAMIKAILINSADNFSSQTAPSNNIGWGIIDLDSTLYFASDATTQKLLLVDDTIGVLTGEQVDYHFSVPSGASNLKIALVWTDYPGNPAVTRQIVNDVDLIVYGGGTSYRGNQYSGGYSAANPSGRDSINVEECARIASPAAGDWRVTIQGRNIPYGPQPYALVIKYNGSAVAGVIKLNKPVYRCNDYNVVDTVRIRVEDTNYGSAVTRDSFRVVINSKFTETQPESVWVRELAESSYVFTGQIPLLFNKPTHNDGRLSVCQGDTIIAQYTDTNPAYTTVTWALVDAYYFVISNVHAENIGANLADVCWTSSEGANGTVYYGTNPSNLNLTVSVDTPFVTPHRIKLSGLTPRTTYYYDVMSRDFRGNMVRDNNDGRHYSFTTQALAGIDILVALCDGNSSATNQGQALPGLATRFRKAIETGGWNYTWWQTSNYNGDLPPRNVARDYKAIFVPNEDEYPEFLPQQMDTIQYYEEGGCRIAFSSHDLLWYSWDPAGGNPQIGHDSMWCKNYMHCRYQGDIVATGSFRIYGVSGDPVTGNYTAGVTYSPHRSGADGDTVVSIDTPPNNWDTGGSSAYIWKWNAAGGNNVGNRWESGQNHGTPGQGVWGGQRVRTIMNAFSVTQLDTLILPNILNDQFIWLIGHDHPDLTISSPATGGNYTSSPISIQWTATYYGGAANDTTWLEYSPDNGQTWFTITSGAGITSPYAWNVSALQNLRTYQVRVTVSDRNVYPSLKGSAKTGSFTINIAGNDDLGPKVVPNSIVVPNNPKYVTATDTMMQFTAVVSDSETGMSNIAAAEWRIINSTSGTNPMTAVDGNFNQVLEQVRGTIRFQYSPGAVSVCSLQVRGQDNAVLLEEAANWGGWYTRTFTLYDGIVRPIGVEELNTGLPTAYALYTAQPNPAVNRLAINFAIPKADHVCLKVYNSLGQLVRTLVNDVKQPGYYSVLWDGKDDTGHHVAAGIYFYQFTTNAYQETKKAVLVK